MLYQNVKNCCTPDEPTCAITDNRPTISMILTDTSGQLQDNEDLIDIINKIDVNSMATSALYINDRAKTIKRKLNNIALVLGT